MTISAKVIADSVSQGIRITTFELEYPRFIHAEFMTHRLFSRNAQSSRAVPIKKQIENIEENPAMPIHWGKHQPGMQAKEECRNPVNLNGWNGYPTGAHNGCDEYPWTAWALLANNACDMANRFADAGYHKQIVNRLTEPFAHIKVVCTATEYDNFFWLRRHPDAQPEIQELADRMWEAREASNPMPLTAGDWHVPYYEGGHISYGSSSEIKNALMISSSCCAQVSYRRLDDTLETAERVYKRLVEAKPVHASPFEHQATPSFSYEDAGITHFTVDDEGARKAWSGNFRGWIQHRQLLEDHANWSYDG